MQYEPQTLVLGIGNMLLTDEGAGLHALNQLQAKYPDVPGIEFIDGGTLSFTLSMYIEECDNLIVLDAAQLKQPAGSVETFVDEGMDHFLGTSKRSVHEVGLLDLMDIARITDTLPVHRALIAIQPEYLGWGTRPTAAVKNALPQAVSSAEALIEHWQISPSKTPGHEKVNCG